MTANNVNGYGKLFTVIKEFNARLGDELNISPGDTVELISDDSEYDDGWYMGKNLTTNKVGLYPKVFTKQITSTNAPNKQPTILRSRSRRLTPQGSPVTPAPPFGHAFGHDQQQQQQQQQTQNQHQQKQKQNTHVHSHREHEHQDQDIGLTAPNANSTFVSTNSNDSSRTKFSSVNRALTDIDNALKELQDQDVSTTTSVDDQSASNNTSNTNLTEFPAPLDPSDVESWTPEQVTQYFSYLNFDIESAGKFARHKINGQILIQLELSYLKELDIASFGTRFEMYKEIEELRLAARNKSYKKEFNHQPSNRESRESQHSSHNRYSNNSNHNNNNNGNKNHRSSRSSRGSISHHARKRSQSMDDIPSYMNSTRSPQKNQFGAPRSSAVRPMSVLPQPPKFNEENGSSSDFSSSEDDFQAPHVSSSTGLFESPRKAPQPPDFPSPVLNQEFKFGGGGLSGSGGGDIDTSEFSAPQAKFGTRGSSNNSSGSLPGGHGRNQSGSSSVYTNVKHNRTSSSLSFVPSDQPYSPSHSRKASDQMNMTSLGGLGVSSASGGGNFIKEQPPQPLESPPPIPQHQQSQQSHGKYSSLFSSSAAAERENFSAEITYRSKILFQW
ncbi:unnamed protein product [Ambrosiozyma monospora]|uniref:Unnamed protein product n=1 Tax=Ambrosiozyma monospora TaxID=43982 RepID=A0A9W7DGY6_AMBMO|nr:unnamed protein product [Ambrosiozyma monospora]